MGVHAISGSARSGHRRADDENNPELCATHGSVQSDGSESESQPGNGPASDLPPSTIWLFSQPTEPRSCKLTARFCPAFAYSSVLPAAGFV